MIRLITAISVAAVLFTACRSTLKFHASFTEDKPLFAAVNELIKHPDNTKAQQDVKSLYALSVERHEQAAAVYRTGTDENRWDKILREYDALQQMYTSAQSAPVLLNFVQPRSYLQQMQDVREDAAAYYYEKGNNLLAGNTREQSLQANEAFGKTNRYVNGYKDAKELMARSYEQSVVNVVVNRIENDNLFFNTWGNTGFRYRPEDYQESLVRELGGRNANIVPARFYTDRDADRENIEADWVVDVRWRNIDANGSLPYKFSRNVSRSIEIGKDSAGKPVYKTVNATLHVTRRTFTVNGALDYRVSDIVNNKNVDQGLLTQNLSWDDSYATYTGDSRALDDNDWLLVRNRNSNFGPSKEEVLNNLMRRMYPDLRRRIEQAAS
ncbi:hypothetical protein [Paraflavitalea sp. CAU 1676]|uniref:hypothetical protein n=1 Tax=Paraflavitalea sp. CAU 1676 TaxID=3032598 RepID=UPI0023DB1800|nr:hypothetical protein [Paraflavitalea sp. CAU 1676]MDF2190967.1 hypothetical protein [Paraflavitalea sp. CAU 1676]